MAKKPTRKPASKAPKAKSASSLMDKLKARWGSKAPIIMFLVGFGALMALYYLFFSTDFYHQYIFQPVVQASAWMSGGVLNLLGQGVNVRGTTISNAAFNINISVGCDGLEAIALFMAAVLAYPQKWKLKLIGAAAGFAFLMFMNLVRIVTLFLTGIYWKAAFDAMHLEVWQALFLILALGSFLVWVIWAGKKEGNTDSTENSPSPQPPAS